MYPSTKIFSYHAVTHSIQNFFFGFSVSVNVCWLP